MQKYLYFTVSKFPTNDKKKGIFKRANTRNHVILGADKQVPELHHLSRGNQTPQPAPRRGNPGRGCTM